MQFYKQAQSHAIIFYKHDSVTSVAVIRMSHNKNKINIQ
jgi:hypothetical protein